MVGTSLEGMRGESAGPSGRSAAAADPWAAALASLHRNVSQFGENLGRLQHTLSSQMAQLGQPHRRRTAVAALPVASVSQAAVGGAAAAAPAASWSGGGGGGVSKEEIGRATWTFLHTLAAQYPNHPTRQQKRDARNLVRVAGGVAGGAALPSWMRCAPAALPPSPGLPGAQRTTSPVPTHLPPQARRPPPSPLHRSTS